MKILQSLLLLTVGLLIQGCASKNFTNKSSALVVFKTPHLKYADMSFIYSNSEDMQIDMYSNGRSIMSLNIDTSSVCMSLFECMDKRSFNEKVLSSYYEDDILQKIFKGNSIFNEQNIVLTPNGFKQNVTSKDKYDIEYTVFNNKIKFRDRINKILIKIKRIP